MSKTVSPSKKKNVNETDDGDLNATDDFMDSSMESGKEGLGLKSTLHGTIYQLKLLLFTFLTAAAKEDDFRIATEVNEAAKFDDMVFIRRNLDADVDNPENLKFNFFQAKHCRDGEKKISHSDLKREGKTEPYSLLKYFRSFQTIKKNFKKYTMEKFVICSNLELDLPDCDSNTTGMTKQKIILPYFDYPGFISYKLVVAKTDPLWHQLINSSTMHRIAKTLIKHIILKRNNSKQKLELYDDILKDSNNHVCLFEYGILVRDGNTAKFDSDFLDGKNNNAKHFFGIFEQLCKEKNIDLKHLKNEYLQISNTFGKYSSSYCGGENNLFFEEYNSKDVEEFFEMLVFMQTPNEDDFPDVLRDHLRDVDSKLQLMDIDFARTYFQEFTIQWMKDKFVTYKEKMDIKDVVEEIKQMLATLQFVGINSVYCNELKKHKISFNNDKTKGEIQNFLTGDDVILHLKTKQTLFTAIKTHEVLSSNKHFKNFGDSFIFNNLLVIVCDKGQENDFISLKNNLLKIVSEKKKIIFITNSEDYNFSAKQVVVDEIMVSDLTTKSKFELIKKSVVFQGKRQSLYNLIGTRTNLINNEMLLQLVMNNDIYIGKSIEMSAGYDSTYVPRKFHRDIFLKEHYLFNENFDNDTFIIENRPNHQFRNVVYPKWISLSEYPTFDKKNNYISKKGKGNLHVLYSPDYESSENSYQWIKSYGSISNLSKCGEKLFCRSGYRSLNEDEVLKLCLPAKTFIIADVAGMGKSTVLTSLILELKENDKRAFWVIRFSYNKIKCLLKMKEYSEIPDLIDDLLNDELKHAKSYNESKSDYYEKNIYEYYLKMGRVVIVYDGYDEIESTFVKQFDDMLKYFRQKNAIIWVTTRTQYREKLEEMLGVFSYSFTPFDEDEKLQFLTSFWRINYKNVFPASKITRLQEYAKIIFNKYLNNCGKNIVEKSNTALIVKMFAQIFQKDSNNWEGCFSFIDKETNDPPNLPDFECLNLFEVYEIFTKNKLNRYVKEKDNEVPMDVQECHQLLAVHALLSAEILHLLLNEKEDKILKKYLKNDNNGIYGMIDYTNENEVYFVHSTFAEFFAAKFISSKVEVRPKEVFKCMDYIIARASNAFMNFILHLLYEELNILRNYLNGDSLLGYAIKENLMQLTKYLITDDVLNPENNQNRKSPLHYASQAGNTKMFVYVLCYMYNVINAVWKPRNHSPLIYLVNYVLLCDRDGKTPMDYAEENNHQDIREILKAIKHISYEKYPKCVVEKAIPYENVYTSISNEGYVKLFTKFLKYENLKVTRILYDNLEDESIKKDMFKKNGIGITIIDKVYSNFTLNEEDQFEKLLFLCQQSSHFSGYLEVSSLTKLNVKAVTHGRLDLAIKLLKSDKVENYFNCFKCLYGNNYYKLTKEEDSPSKVMNKFFIEYQKHFPDLIGSLFLNSFEANFKSSFILKLFTKKVVPKRIISNGTSHFEVLHLLEEIDINVKNENGETPLFFACKSKNYKYSMLKFLLQRGADINIANVKGETPLSMAISCESKKINSIRYLIKNGADIHAVNKNGENLLFYAVKNLPAMKTLVKNGICVYAKNNENQTPFDVVAEDTYSYYTGCMEYLLQRGIIYNSEYLKKTTNEKLKEIVNNIHELFVMTENNYKFDVIATEKRKKLVNSRRDYSVNGKINTETLLHCAARKNNLKAVKWLINNGANVNSIDSLKKTPKMVAKSLNYYEIMYYMDNAKEIIDSDETCVLDDDSDTGMY